MKLFYMLVLVVATCSFVRAQNLIINGSFENNTAAGNTTNLSTNWSNYVSDSWKIDDGHMNLDTSYSCGHASDGNWFVTNCPGCSTVSHYIGFSLKFSSQLTQGAQYTLSFDKAYCGHTTDIYIGISNDSSFVGTNVRAFSAPVIPAWVHESYVFQAPIAARFLTVGTGPLTDTGLIALDNFRLEAGATAVEEPSANNISISIYPDPAKDQITIFTNEILKSGVVEIYNVVGENILKEFISNTSEKHLDVRTIPDGIYFVKLSGTDKQVTRKLIIHKD